MKYERPVRELLAECVNTLPEPFTRAQILSWFRQHYPQIAEGTVAAHVQGLTDLPNRARNFPSLASTPPLLVRVAYGTYRRASSSGTAFSPPLHATASPQAGPPGDNGLILVGCVKTKAAQATVAKDLYQSPLFRRRRGYAERSGQPWFVVSSRWGLVHPDEVIAPYDVYLADQPIAYRRAWASFVTAQLLARTPVNDLRIEIHAGDAYVIPLRSALEAHGAIVVDPVDARSMGETLAWYGKRAPAATVTGSPAVDDEDSGLSEAERLIGELAAALSDRSALVSVTQLLNSDPSDLSSAGLYGWWVDTAGAHDLTAGLGEHVDAGLIYAGQAGATRHPSGKRSTSTLWTRLTSMHLAGRAEFSTFRRTLAAALTTPLRLRHEDDPRLSEWMTEHLSVATVPHPDPDSLGLIEAALLQRLDPPLNLKGVPPTALRTRLRALRSARTTNDL